MKNKLFILTIVMLLVLALSLTTATYAWFTASSVTRIEGFNVSVTANNDVNIGVKKDCSSIATGTITTSMFVTDAVQYTQPVTPGQVGGTWTGTDGLSANLEHDIEWGAQSKSVAANIDSEDVALSTDPDDYTDIGTGLNNANYIQINAANLGDDALTNVAAALPNYGATKDPATSGDYCYMLLGVQPVRDLDVCTLVIAIDFAASTSSTLGILAGLHVAYRVGKNGAAASSWSDVDIFGNSYHYTTQKTGVVTNITDTSGNEALATAYEDTYGSAPTNTTYCALIQNLSVTMNAIDQVEIIVYLDGNDGDVNNSALGSSGAIKIFFCTELAD